MDVRYPIGKFVYGGTSTEEQRRQFIAAIEEVPARLREALRGMTAAQFDTPYRDGGWTVRQVVHHLPDSHLNAYIRFKLAMTESEPTIKPYDETKWAELPDTRETPVETSLAMTDALHQRWTILLRSLKPADFEMKLNHPERGIMTVDELLALYAWHGRHHVAHITTLRDRLGWSGAGSQTSR
jgi:uncharacterized damage-inducible protein DinB